jgi:acyl-CoA thioester hydrolase
MHRAIAESAFNWSLRVYFEDTDTAGIVYHANYLKYMERARTEWLRALGLPHHEMMHEHGGVFVVQSLSIQYLGPARLDDALQVSCNLSELGRASLSLTQQVLRGEQKLTESQVRLGHIDQASGRPSRMPTVLFERLSGHAKSI